MKILIYSMNYAPEPVGIGKYSGELGGWLANRGHQVRVIAAHAYFPQWRTTENRYRLEIREGAQIWRCPIWVPLRPNGITRLLHLASFALSSLVPVLMQKGWEPDIILCVAPSLFCAPAGLWLAELCGRKPMTWLHVQDFELDAAFQLGLLRGDRIRDLTERWERCVLQQFARVSSISNAMVKHTHDKGVAPEKTILFPNWVDIEEITSQSEEERLKNRFRLELGIKPDQLVLLYSGSMNKKQGLEVLVEVMKTLSHNEKLKWILAGEGPGKESLSEATKDMPQVRIMPLQPVELINDWLNLADVHLLPQKAAAADLVLPSKLMGMLASGRPVIAASPSGSTLGVMAEEAGCRVEPGDARGFADAVNILTNNAEVRLSLGRKARQLAERRFSKDQVLRRYEEDILTARTRTYQDLRK